MNRPKYATNAEQRLVARSPGNKNYDNRKNSLHPNRGFCIFIGWMCGFALAWHFMGADILAWLRLAFFPDMPAPPSLSGSETLVTVLLSMLGLGGLRTVEKLKGVSREKWK
ncbi:hypothetical protein SAMN04488071_2188 [Kordiimonas lacus]|uniref:Holin of 3TMs, for gene-transfer release n=1 Tax=Kordiimonas lacus TaxID=637679 RepID=A0A1G7AFP8_9PROT|nr:hypothetical protein SAMN04488071_2188 [Kordiimonas lacus]